MSSAPATTNQDPKSARARPAERPLANLIHFVFSLSSSRCGVAALRSAHARGVHFGLAAVRACPSCVLLLHYYTTSTTTTNDDWHPYPKPAAPSTRGVLGYLDKPQNEPQQQTRAVEPIRRRRQDGAEFELETRACMDVGVCELQNSWWASFQWRGPRTCRQGIGEPRKESCAAHERWVACKGPACPRPGHGHSSMKCERVQRSRPGSAHPLL